LDANRAPALRRYLAEFLATPAWWKSKPIWWFVDPAASS
jgi:hypothetical protein